MDGSNALTKKDTDLLERIDTVIETSLKNRDPDMALQFGNLIVRAIHIGGVALAKYLWTMNTLWGSKYMPSDASFSEVAQTQLGIANSTFQQYVAMWEWLKDFPELWSKPVRGLLLCNAAMREQQFTPEDMDELTNSNSVFEIRSIVRKVRGHRTKSGTALLLLLNGQGQLMARFGDDATYEPAGYIKTDKTKLMDAVRSRLNSAGVQIYDD